MESVFQVRAIPGKGVVGVVSNFKLNSMWWVFNVVLCSLVIYLNEFKWLDCIPKKKKLRSTPVTLFSGIA